MDFLSDCVDFNFLPISIFNSMARIAGMMYASDRNSDEHMERTEVRSAKRQRSLACHAK